VPISPLDHGNAPDLRELAATGRIGSLLPARQVSHRSAPAGAACGHHAWSFRPLPARPRRRACHARDHPHHADAARGPDCAGSFQALALGERVGIGGVAVRLLPAGHVLGSAQVVMEHAGARAVASGDYKRRADPTTRPFELERCHLFITEATFGLPVFRHEPDTREIGRLLASVHANTDRTHLIGAYGLGSSG
jgi:hypothetical protein